MLFGLGTYRVDWWLVRHAIREVMRSQARAPRVVQPAPASLGGVDMRRLAGDERADFAAFLATLCAGWRVRDVAAHVISYDELGPRELLGYAVRGRFWSSRINAIALARYQALTPEELLALMMARLEPRGLPAALGCRVALVECVIHHQDVRRALGRPRVIPPERLVTALRWAMIGPDIGGLWRTRGVRVVATDLGFAAGAGPEARGPAEALLMTIAGRRGAARELSGPGQRKLASRIDLS